MKGLDLSEAYYHAHGAAMIANQFALYSDRIAVGFVGPGSECFGFDDDISRDHDWGPGFCMWLTSEDFEAIGSTIQKAYENLPEIFQGFGPRIASPSEQARTGVCEISTFYKTYTGLGHVPKTTGEWLHIPEEALATCTNGKIFSDPQGEFSRWRKDLLNFYPDEVRLKKIASRCFTAAQAGQYNFGRSLKRNELFAAKYSEITFCADIISLIFILNRRYKPFYKWMHSGLKKLPLLGEATYQMISDLTTRENYSEKTAIIEDICSKTIEELKREGISDSDSSFLLDHALSIFSRITDPILRAGPLVVK